MPASTSADALPTLHEFFAPGGVLAQSSLAYEQRKGQYEMAKAVEQAAGWRDEHLAATEKKKARLEQSASKKE